MPIKEISQQDERAQELTRIVTDFFESTDGIELEEQLLDIFHGYLGSDLVDQGIQLSNRFYLIRQILQLNSRLKQTFQTSNPVS